MSQKTRARFVKLTLLILISIAIQTFAMSVTATGNGQWVPSGAPDNDCPSSAQSGGCPGGSTCSEWDVDGESIMSCCIATQDVGSGDINAACLAY